MLAEALPRVTSPSALSAIQSILRMYVDHYHDPPKAIMCMDFLCVDDNVVRIGPYPYDEDEQPVFSYAVVVNETDFSLRVYQNNITSGNTTSDNPTLLMTQEGFPKKNEQVEIQGYGTCIPGAIVVHSPGEESATRWSLQEVADAFAVHSYRFDDPEIE